MIRKLLLITVLSLITLSNVQAQYVTATLSMTNPVRIEAWCDGVEILNPVAGTEYRARPQALTFWANVGGVPTPSWFNMSGGWTYSPDPETIPHLIVGIEGTLTYEQQEEMDFRLRIQRKRPKSITNPYPFWEHHSYGPVSTSYFD